MDLLPSERAALDELRTWLRARFGGRVRELALFGSRARGEGHDGSDLDVLVVVDDLTSAEAHEVAQFRGDLLTKHDVLVSPFVLSAARMSELRARERRIAIEIDRDGVGL
ncbi:MAG TPA: nucleotidyltransferase domain-containing protein [Anaeromyxobacteraceae bacterium]|nr:nucleotidyltransferase domain-containing protein [Anaeromyxobacteraceae bacterium]